ncbi:uncharacterized protein Z520_02334 [Fonsecaea multimorphosa CBS 102226]|uniref:Uncharacterized protein n=1 Tax=Fonsecaea multimorphosa CBS 102226 TaxID=1442371 RepID=A0A0D2HJW3_9EURO|nr:uncharacterized protein Z520_02334 [Fonsecaea multimorphosa CBS 102226]KIY02196.1 hypothetical protein Z520_02334 [Fonsecaea multimorphosa CBS 102226]OAL29389.1 hypothetical protein AYO22_02283 [Fonsecaea multimorphosa]
MEGPLSVSVPGVTFKSSTTAGARAHVQEAGKEEGMDDAYTQPGPSDSHSLIKSTKTHTGFYSEHGHSLSHIRPITKHPGSSVTAFFSGVFTTIIGISTLGASITFSYVLSNNTSTPRAVFDVEQIQEFLAISWLLFLLALAIASLGSTILNFFKDHWTADWDGLNGKTSQRSVQWYAVVAAGLMGGLIIGAFVLLCLVVVAHTTIVGWIALGFTSLFGAIIFVALMHQAPWPWRNNTPSPSPRHRTAGGHDGRDRDGGP